MIKNRIARSTQLFSTFFIVSLLVFAGCSNGSAASNNPGGNGSGGNGNNTPVQQAGPFIISNLQLPVEMITEGQQVTIFVDVINDDACDGTQPIIIYVENMYEVCVMEQEQAVSLDADEKRTIGFTFTFDEYDIYYIKAGETRQELIVYPLGPIPGEHGEGPFCSQCH